MRTPLVSIVIPCFNAEPYVGEAIQSALDQTYPHKEVIVIDDGSTDGSLDVIRSFGDAVRWESGPNRGGSAARNRGIELARGELIQFLDADDLLHARKLEFQVSVAARSTEQLIYCDWETRYFATNGHVQTTGSTCADLDPVVFAIRSDIATEAPLHWKSALQAIGGFREELPCSQERDLHLRLACAGAQFHHLPETLFTVRRVAGSVSSDSIRVLRQRREIFWHVYNGLKGDGGMTERRAAAFAAALTRDGRSLCRQGLWDEAILRFGEARQMHPGGGIDVAYGPWARVARAILGPSLTERLAMQKRSWTSKFAKGKAEYRRARD